MFRHLLTFVWNRKGKNALLIVELAFSFLVLYGVYAFVLHNLESYNTPLGFETKDRINVNFNLPYNVDSAEVASVKEELTRQIRAIQGVKNTSFSFSIAPFTNSNWVSSQSQNGYELSSNMIMADEDYRDVMEIELLEGRWYTEDDELEKYPGIVINQKLRASIWKDSTVLGRVIFWNGEEKKIVGVADHYKYLGEFDNETNIIFEDFKNDTEMHPTMFIQLEEGTPATIQEKINNVVMNTAKGWEFNIQDLDETRIGNSRYYWIPIVAFLGICVFLVINIALGLFGVLLYNIKKRRSEIGLRRAIGAPTGSIFYQLIIEMMLISSLALIIGFFFAVQVPVLDLFDVKNDIYLQSGIGAGLTIILLVLICTLYPGTQAILVHPATALHEE